MDLGTFSVSLAVRDLSASRAFYSTLGFEAIGGQSEQGWLIMKNGSTVIGLFQGMFEKNTLTFNPGWKGPHQAADQFTDVREIKARLLEAGVECTSEIKSESGPAHIVVHDPDELDGAIGWLNTRRR